ncbi:MAG: hypothetical protein AAGI03_15865 [Pseudomonadota bacterium]
MPLKDRIIYGVVMAIVVFALAQFVLSVGSLVLNVLFAIAMGLFAILAVSIATRIGGKYKR